LLTFPHEYASQSITTQANHFLDNLGRHSLRPADDISFSGSNWHISGQLTRSKHQQLALGPPLFCSIIVRWAVLPRVEQASKALVVFVMGLALAESCGIIGTILGGEHKTLLFAASLLAVLQYIPLFASRFEQRSSTPPNTKVVK
jgi:hypothetical protein